MGIKVNGIKKITDLVAATAINDTDSFMIQTENGSRKATGATLKTLINNTFSPATTSSDGLMSAQDKSRLDTVYADYSSALTALGVIE